MYLNYCVHDVSAVATLKKMSLEYCMHNSLLVYVCFQHASYFTIYIGIVFTVYIVAWCLWFIYGYVVRRLVNNNNKKISNKVVNHTYASFLLTFLPYRLTNHSLRSRLNNSRYLLGVGAGASATTETRMRVSNARDTEIR